MTKAEFNRDLAESLAYALFDLDEFPRSPDDLADVLETLMNARDEVEVGDE